LGDPLGNNHHQLGGAKFEGAEPEGKMRRMKDTRRRFRMRMTKERWMQSMQEGDENVL